MTVTPTVSLRLSLATQERLRLARQPGESQDALISRALDALAGHQTAKDSPAGATPYAGLALRLDSLQDRLEVLENWRRMGEAPDATHPAMQEVIQAGRTATQEATQPAMQPPQGVTRPAIQPVAQPPGAYPPEVKRLALEMQDQGQPNRIIAAAILERTGRKPDGKNMTALLKNWRKALGAP